MKKEKWEKLEVGDFVKYVSRPKLEQLYEDGDIGRTDAEYADHVFIVEGKARGSFLNFNKDLGSYDVNEAFSSCNKQNKRRLKVGDKIRLMSKKDLDSQLRHGPTDDWLEGSDIIPFGKIVTITSELHTIKEDGDAYMYDYEWFYAGLFNHYTEEEIDEINKQIDSQAISFK